MAIAIYLNGTTGAADGTLEVPGDGAGIELSEVGSVAVFHFQAPNGKQNAESVLVTAPTDCQVSLDGNNYFGSVSFGAGTIKDTNVACYVKRTAITQVDARLETGLSTTPHCASVTVENIPVPDTTSPTLTGTLTATSNDGQVTLDWPDATDNIAVTGYDVEYGTSAAYGTAVTSAVSNKTITALTNGTLYYFRVRAYDAAGNKSAWVTTTATPAIATDTTAPTLTGTLSATAGTLQVALDWPDATDNIAVTGYDIEYGTTESYGTTTTSTTSAKTITGLAPGSPRYFRVRAYDAAGNKSAWLTATATPLPDITQPTLTGTLSAVASSGQVALDWPDATDNIAVAGYDVEYGTSTSYGTVTTSATSAKTITGLNNGTLYYFRVRAYDAAGNKSAWLTTTATPAVGAINETFEGTAIDTNLWTPLVAGNGSIALSGGSAQLNSPATTDGMLLYRKAALVRNENKTYRWKTRINSSVANGNYFLFAVEDTAAPFAPNAWDSTVEAHGLAYQANTNAVSKARLMLVATGTTILLGRATTATTGTTRWYDTATNAWVATGQVYPLIAADTDYIMEFSTNTSSQWRLRMLSADETTTLIDTGLQSWSAITSFSNSAYLIIGGEPYANMSTASASIDWYTEAV